MANLNSEQFRPAGEDLASRVSARQLREQVEQAILNGKLAVVDLSNVSSISESYADELFAVLVENRGLEWFSSNVKILTDQAKSVGVLRSVATAIRRRLENQNKTDIKASIDDLIAAKRLASTRSSSYCN